ncbi:hypothetical protein FRX31_035272, partial [Thalictrum thalictroides]
NLLLLLMKLFPLVRTLDLEERFLCIEVAILHAKSVAFDIIIICYLPKNWR